MSRNDRRALLQDAVLAAAAAALLGTGAVGFGRTLMADNQDQAGQETRTSLSPAVENKLDQITQKDEELMARFSAVKDEMQTLKVRVLRHPQNP